MSNEYRVLIVRCCCLVCCTFLVFYGFAQENEHTPYRGGVFFFVSLRVTIKTNLLAELQLKENTGSNNCPYLTKHSSDLLIIFTSAFPLLMR